MARYNFKHGHSKSPEFRCWSHIKDRCYNPSDKAFKNYGARGVIMCDSWLNDFSAFISDMGSRPSKAHSIDRIDGSGNYEPSNCRWATRQQQNRNIRARNPAGIRGVYTTKYGTYEVFIQVDGRRKFLGTHKTTEEAMRVRQEAEAKYWGEVIQ